MAKLIQSLPLKIYKQDTINTIVRTQRNVLFTADEAIDAGATKSYNVATTLGADVALYDMSSIEIEAYVIDSQTNSDTKDYYVRADAVLATGFKKTGEVMVKNITTNRLFMILRISINKAVPV